MSQTDSSSPFLPLPDGMVIASVHAKTDRIVVPIACHLSIALCPLCGEPSERIHGTLARATNASCSAEPPYCPGSPHQRHTPRSGHTCTVRFSLTDGLEIEITDDGIGLPQDHQPGVGLLSMRERAAELSGSCVIEKIKESGTRVCARLPLAKE